MDINLKKKIIYLIINKKFFKIKKLDNKNIKI